VYIVNSRRRLNAVFLFFFVFLVLCIARLFFIQFFNSNYFASIAQKQHSLFVELEPRRGTIFDSNLKPQAVNVSVDSLYASPNFIPDKNKETIIRQLAPIISCDDAYLRERLYRKKSFIWLARKLLPSQSEAIKRLNIKGLDFFKENKRSYPNSYLASHIIGFCGLDDTGLEGIELGYNGFLKGTQGWAMILRDARQNKLDLGQRMAVPQDGYNLILTIDEVIQYMAERELDRAYKAFHAKGASIIVMDPHTGAILAMANRPTFDLNQYNASDKEHRRNRAISDLFEPGSVFKIVTASAAIEEKRVAEEDKFFCENGSYFVGGRILHDHQPHGWLTFREVIEESSNIGTTKVAQILGPQTVYQYVKLFGFGTKTGIDLLGEISGMIKEPRFWSKTSISAVPIGQEVGVTALQLAAAISVIGNGGQLMKPYIVKEIRDNHGETIKSFSPVVVRKVISLDTANRIKKILTGVVEEGTGKLAQIKGFSAAGKTGTAQKLEANGSYSHNKFVASFIGFAPAEDPVITVVVTVDEPHPYYFGGVVAAPVFKNLAGDVLKYLNTKRPPNESLVLNESERAN